MNEAPLLRALEALGPAAAAHATHRDADGRPRYTNRLVLEGSLYLRQHAHQPIELAEIGHGFPGLRQQQLERIHRHGTHIGIRLDQLGFLTLDAANAETADAPIGIELNLAKR